LESSWIYQFGEHGYFDVIKMGKQANFTILKKHVKQSYLAKFKKTSQTKQLLLF